MPKKRRKRKKEYTAHLVKWYFERGDHGRLEEVSEFLKSPELLDLPDWKRRKLGKPAGIYVLYKRVGGDERILYYVGRTRRDLPKRVGDHLDDHHKHKWDEFTLYGTDKRNAKALETLLIKIADPIGNRGGKGAHFSGAVNLKKAIRDFHRVKSKEYAR